MLIAILEDEKLLAANIKKKLEKNWYAVNIFNNISNIKKNPNLNYDLYIVDISLPDWDWLEFINYLREEKKISAPIIITSGYNDIDTKVYWLQVWADDYLAKPFSPEELVARIKALIRRAYEISNNYIIKYKDFIYDSQNKTITKWNQIIELNKKELEIVDLFLVNKWKLITKSKLISSIWWNYENLWVSDNTINVTIYRIRAQLWETFKLKTIVWKWYILEK
jgi:DNA-binding response OmpR family regulator